MEKAEDALSESITLRYGEPSLELNWNKIMDEMPQPQRMIIIVDLTKIIMVDFQKWLIGIEWDEMITHEPNDCIPKKRSKLTHRRRESRNSRPIHWRKNRGSAVNFSLIDAGESAIGFTLMADPNCNGFSYSFQSSQKALDQQRLEKRLRVNADCFDWVLA